MASNDKEVEALQKFRVAIADILQPKYDDAFLLRWLRARNLNTDEAERMLRKHLEWRQQYKMDTILTDYVPREHVKRYFPMDLCGYDKEGSPIMIVPFGYYDIRGLLKSVRKEELVGRFEAIMEESLMRMQEQTKALGQPVTKHWILVDLENFGITHFLWKPAFNFIKRLAFTNDNNYPETLKRVLYINANRFAHICHALLKPFIHENTLKKLQIFGKDGWQEYLYQHVDRSQIPDPWGGTFKQDNNKEQWWDVLKMSGQIPSSLYNDPAKHLSNEEGITTVTVSSNAEFCIETEVKQVESALRWIFQTEDSDIGFGIFFKTDNGREEIIPLDRVDTHLFAEEGVFVCEKVGKYEFCFDNKFSLLRSKKLTYKVETLTPEEYKKTVTED